MEVSSKYEFVDGKMQDKRTLPELLAIYNNNLRVRMDLVADIVTSVPVSENTRWLLKDVLKKFTDNKILADTISGVNLEYEFVCTDKDVKVSIPNDILGMDAFCVILENIIRNCAKHGNNGGKVKLTIHIEDGYDRRTGENQDELTKINLPNYYKISIHQDCKKKTICTLYPNCDEIVNKIRLEINKPILDNTQSLRAGGWGILEMKISAAYLRKIPPNEIDDGEYKLEIFEGNESPKNGCWKNGYRNTSKNHPYTPYILTADCCDTKECGESSGLGYSFFLMKPKEVLIFDYRNEFIKSSTLNAHLESKNLTFDDFRNDLLSFGISYKKVDEINMNDIYNQKILIIIPAIGQKESIKIEIDENETGLPGRIIWIDEIVESKRTLLTDITKPEVLINNAWEIIADEFFKKIKSYKKDADCLCINSNTYFLNRKHKCSINAILPISLDRTPGHALGLYTDDKTKDIVLKKKFIDYDYFDIGSTFSFSKFPKSRPDITSFMRHIRDTCDFESISFAESVITRIGIIDERLQDFAINSNYPVPKLKTNLSSENEFIKVSEKYIRLFEAMNIYMPLKKDLKGKEYDSDYINDINSYDIDLMMSDFNTKIDHKAGEKLAIKECINKWIRHFTSNEDVKLDYLIVHLGVLEKLLGSTDLIKLNKLYLSEFKTKCNGVKIIIISGRGKPNNIPEFERFLNYSQVAQYISDNQSKYMLTDLCYSSRKPKPKLI